MTKHESGSPQPGQPTPQHRFPVGSQGVHVLNERPVPGEVIVSEPHDSRVGTTIEPGNAGVHTIPESIRAAVREEKQAREAIERRGYAGVHNKPPGI